MARKITNEDLANRGVMGLPDVPGLTAIEMQKKLEEIPREVIIPRYNELVDSVTSICDEFSKLNSYAVGDYCIYQNKLYKCNTATSGDWDASKWTETSVGDELKSVNSNLTWNKLGRFKLNETLTLPNNWNELYFISSKSETAMNGICGVIYNLGLTNTPYRLAFNGHIESNNGQALSFLVSTKSIAFNQYTDNGTTTITNGICDIYYR